MGFTRLGDVKPPGLDCGPEGLAIGQAWVRPSKKHLPWPAGRVHISDLIVRKGVRFVKFWDTTLDPGRPALELSVESFLREFVKG